MCRPTVVDRKVLENDHSKNQAKTAPDPGWTETIRRYTIDGLWLSCGCSNRWVCRYNPLDQVITPLGVHFEFVALPARFYFILGGMVLFYLFVVELAKRGFYRWCERGRGRQGDTPQKH